MKLKYFLLLTLSAVLLSGCSLTVSSQTNDEELSVEQTNRNSANKKVNQNKPPAKPVGLAVCPNPDAPCHHREKEFADWELSYKLPAKIAPNKTYESAPFYAVILKIYDLNADCDGGDYIEAAEDERKRVQNLQLNRKVFASYGCPNMDAVSYNFEGRMSADKERVLIDNFIAIYAGETQEEAENLRQNIKDEYPKAQVKKMTAVWERIEQ